MSLGSMIFRSRTRGGKLDDVASVDELLEEIDELTRNNREHREAELERQILALRHRAGLKLVERGASDLEYPAPAFDQLPNGSGLPEITPGELTPGVLRAAMLRSGCLLVRGLVEPDSVARLVEEIDRAFEARQAEESDGSYDTAYYEKFTAEPRFDLSDRQWIGGRSELLRPPTLRGDRSTSSTPSSERAAPSGRWLPGERPAVSVNKCTLRRVFPDDFRGSPGASARGTRTGLSW